MIGLLIPTHGDCRFVVGNWDSGASLRSTLGCSNFEYIEVTPLPSGPNLAVYFDEDAKYDQAPPNQLATKFVGGEIGTDDFIAGPALLTGFDKWSGAALRLSVMQLIHIAAHFVRFERLELT